MLYLTAYLIVCWLAGAIILVFLADYRRCRQFVRQSRLGIPVLVPMVITILGAPIWLPFVLLTCGSSTLYEAWQRRKWGWFRRKHHEFLFLRVDRNSLPAEIWRFFRKHTPQMMRLGFRKIGDYALRKHPYLSACRFFQSDDGPVFGELLDADSNSTFGFVTVFDDGFYLETSSVEPLPLLEKLRDSRKLVVQCLPNASLEDLYRRHRLAIESLQSTGRSPLEFTPDQVPQVIAYGQRVYSWELYRIGEMDEPPPVAVLPDGNPRGLAETEL